MKNFLSIFLIAFIAPLSIFSQDDCSPEMVMDLVNQTLFEGDAPLPEGAEMNFSVNDESVDGIEGVLEILGTDLATDYTVCVEYTSVECPDPIVVCEETNFIDLLFGGDDWGDDDWGDDWNDSTDGDWDDWGDDWDDWGDDWNDSTDWDGDWDDWGDDWGDDWDDWGNDWDDWGDDWNDSTDWDGDWGDDWGDWGDDWDDWGDDWNDSTDWDGDWDDWDDWDDWGDDWNDNWNDSTDGDWDDWGDNNDEDDYDGEGQVSSIESINSEINISLYPVPAKDNFTVEGLPEGNWEAMIFDSYGRIVSNQLISNFQRVDLSYLANGYYTIHMLEFTGISKRFVIQK